MPKTLVNTLSPWLANRDSTLDALADAFVRRAIDNRGLLTSTRKARPVAERLAALIDRHLEGTADEYTISETAVSLAEQGLSVNSATGMLSVLNDLPWLVKLDQPTESALRHAFAHLQLSFMEKISLSREVVMLRSQETTQEAMQRALQKQLESQQHLQTAQTRQNDRLNAILALNTELARADSQQALLNTAVSGICQALKLQDVTIFEWRADSASWYLNTTTAADLQPGQIIPAAMIELLNTARDNEGECLQTHTGSNGDNPDTPPTTAALILSTGNFQLGGMVINQSPGDDVHPEEYLILLRTFAQGLAAMWQNLFLFTEMSQRTRELEILQGRHIDSLWQAPNARLQATASGQDLTISRQISDGETASDTAESDAETTQALPIATGEQAFGQIALPADLPPTDQEFIEALIHEMGNALNTAHLLQTTRSYSNQLNLAAEVSRAATTILDRDTLMRDVTELIRDRFNLYYVGLFLVDNARNTAVLHAGTGEAGKTQLARNHALALDHESMIGTTVVTGQARAEADVTTAHGFTFNPLLPDTRSELALPLRSRGSTIGALTVQSTDIAAFSHETVTVLQSLADQLAVSIENADLFAQTQDTLAKTSHLFQTSRRMSQARTAADIYQALVNFARLHGGIDAAQILVENQQNTQELVNVGLWHAREQDKTLAFNSLPANKMLCRARLADNQTVIVNRDGSAAPVEPQSTAWEIFQRSDVNSIALVPIHTEGEWLGTLILHSHRTTPWREEELQPFRTVVNQAAVILTNQRLLHQTETLYQIGRQLSSAITQEDALAIAAREVAAYIGPQRVRIVLYDSYRRSGRVMAQHPPKATLPTHTVPVADDLVFNIFQQTLEPLLLPTAVSNPDAARQHLTPFGSEAALLIPATAQQELIGYMALDVAAEARPFTQNDIIFAQTVVDHLTTQLDNIKLLDEALHRAQELITLNQAQANISGILNYKRLAKAIYTQVGRLLDSTTFLLARFDHTTGILLPLLAMHNDQPRSIEPQLLPTSNPVFDFLYAGEEKLVDAAHPLMTDNNLPLSDEPQPAAIWVPLLREGQPTGLLVVQSANPDAYSQTETQLLRSVGTHTSLALANADLFAEIQSKVEEIQAANEQLRELDKLKTQFLANMSHELRTPLNSIIGFSRVILKGIDGPITTEQEEDLTSIFSNGQHLLRMINEILDMAKIEAGKMALAFEETDLQDAARVAFSTVRNLLQSGVVLEKNIAADLPTIEADPLRMRQVLINLLSNASKFTSEGVITLKMEKQGTDRVHIAVQDTGMGIAAADYEKLFRPFEQVDSSNTRAAEGTGLGLPITQWIVNMHNGRIWFESKVGIGTTFHVILPIKQPEEKSE